MPAGGTAPGFAYFAAAKFLGYTAFCRWVIEPRLRETETLVPPGSVLSFTLRSERPLPKIPPAFAAGAVRTAIGVVAGAVAGVAFFHGIPGLEKHNDMVTWIFFVLLVSIRTGEWWLLLWWMYREFPLSKNTRGKLITFGILVSFALDAVGILAAFVLPGGIWIC